MNTKTIQHDGRDIVITPVKVKHLPAFLAAIAPLLQQLGRQTGDSAQDVLLTALATHGTNVITATALGAGVDEVWLGEQTADVVIDLAAAVLEVNLDFFVRQLMPSVTAATASLGRLSSMATGGTAGLAA